MAKRPRLTELKPRLTTLGAQTLTSVGGATERIRGAALQAIRERRFRENPLCVGCQAKDPPVRRVWTELDHKVPLHLGGAETDANRQGLCAECHEEKTAREQQDRDSGGAAHRG